MATHELHATQSEFLSKEELHDLTARTQAARQAAWLSEHGVPHRLIDRRVIASRFHVRLWLEGKTRATGSGPNWSAIA